MNGTNPWARWRVRLGYPVALAYAILAAPTQDSLLAGFAIVLAGIVVRGSAAGHLHKHQRLAVSGPYRFTRNPLYFGSAILATGLLVAGRSWLAAGLVALYFALFYSRVMRAEELELRERYGGAFVQYAARVPLFFPTLRPIPSPGIPFSWSQYRVNREYQAAIGALLGLALLYGKMQFFP